MYTPEIARAAGAEAMRVIERRGNTIFIRLPVSLWRLCCDDGKCSCSTCERTGRAAFWDTLAVCADLEEAKRAVQARGDGHRRAFGEVFNDHTWTVHHPDLLSYPHFRAYELDLDGTASSYTAQSRPEGPGYWSVLIPWTEGIRTEWHPTERTGPFSKLSRGAFKTEGLAIKWAQEKLLGQTFSVTFHHSYPGEDVAVST